MKKIIILLLFISTTAVSYAQDQYFQNSSLSIEKQAKEITAEYNKHLYMNGEQPLLFEKKVAEFLISKNKIKDQYEGKKMLDKLAILSTEETREMGDILTRQQLKKYREVKMKIQPLTVVDEKED
ncbi:hypothetical protein EAX61_11285 [Dokdonia sinensis]|uniref:Uncharacterized protein n=1 Tax=Dokdonia sinensis TaxID=2479847 RepID=A0A3M0FXC6_9FLAO|nr:hypothetical protein [Dokdonia sinensis]RMB57324.1 hypothetical protein EAX61_11285 [Dokdonia sinensis]